jgi:hypothetical protein
MLAGAPAVWATTHAAGGGAGSSLVAAGVAGLGVGLVVRRRPDAARWLRGAAGEASTARLLGRLPSRTWDVRHDLRVPGSRANIDHLVIGPSGVWVIDSKATRARVRARWRTVRLGDHRLDTRPVRWEAQVVADRLGVPARPLIVVHGEGLPRRGGRSDGVWVVPVAGLLPRVRRGHQELDRWEVRDLAERSSSIFRAMSEAVADGSSSRV